MTYKFSNVLASTAAALTMTAQSAFADDNDKKPEVLLPVSHCEMFITPDLNTGEQVLHYNGCNEFAINANLERQYEYGRSAVAICETNEQFNESQFSEEPDTCMETIQNSQGIPQVKFE